MAYATFQPMPTGLDDATASAVDTTIHASTSSLRLAMLLAFVIVMAIMVVTSRYEEHRAGQGD